MQLSRLALARATFMRAFGPHLLRIPAIRARLLGFRARPVEGNVLDEDLAVMLGLGDAIGATDLAGGTPAKSRAQMRESTKMLEEDPVPGMLVEDFTLEHEGLKIPARRYVPAGLSGHSPGVVHYHGGGFVIGDLDTHDRGCQTLARDARVRVIAIDYRLAPENPYPAAVVDSVAAFRAVARRAHEFGMDPQRLAVVGDSAGGNLAAVVARKTRADSIRPALQVLVYPAMDATRVMRSHQTYGNGFLLTTTSMEWFYEQYLGKDPARRREPDASPLFAKDFDGLAPALVYTAGFDPLRDEGLAYAEKIEQAGIPVRYHCFETMTHGFAAVGRMCPAAGEAARKIAFDVAEALRTGLAGSAKAA